MPIYDLLQLTTDKTFKLEVSLQAYIFTETCAFVGTSNLGLAESSWVFHLILIGSFAVPI